MRAVVAAGGKPTSESLARIAAALAPIVEAGRAGGLLRTDVTVDDFIAAKGAIATARPENARRLASILIDGLRFRAPDVDHRAGAAKKPAPRARRRK